jgi:ribosomal protein S13
MLTFLGVTHSLEKQVIRSIQKHHGIGYETAKRIMHENYIHRWARLGDLGEEKLNGLKSSIQEAVEKEKMKGLKLMRGKAMYQAALKRGLSLQ